MKDTKYNDILNLRVTKDTRELIESIARFSGRKRSDVAREALVKGLKG
jgi:uncharacterized protein (DUF1778 family)